MHYLRRITRRVCTTCVPCLATLLVLLLACGVRAEAAVELADFAVAAQSGSVVITWQTGNEIDNAGFRLHREYPELGQNATIIYELVPSPCMGQVTGCEYSHVDDQVQDGITYHYRLESLNVGGGSEFYYLGSATPGAPPPDTPTATPTSLPAATLTPTPTTLATATATDTPEPSLPAVTFTARPDGIVAGECAELHWHVDNAEAVVLDGEGVQFDDSKRVCPQQTQTYELRVFNAAGEFRYQVTVNVSQPTPTSSPTSISAPTSTPTSLPGATSTSTPAALATAIPTTAGTLPPATAPTTAPTGEPPATYPPTTGEPTATPTPTTIVIAAAPISPEEAGARAPQPGGSAGLIPGMAWPTISITAILMFISAASLLGAMLLAIALPLIRKLGL